jgi:hypothetical protein
MHKLQTNTDRLNQTKTRITLPYIHTTSEMAGIDSSDHSTRRTQTLHAHKPTCKLIGPTSLNPTTKHI